MTGRKIIRKLSSKEKIMACVRQLQYENEKVRTPSLGQI